jgi:hypothetical protein
MSAAPLDFPEAFLHYIWKLNLYNQEALYTVSGAPLEICYQGWHNHHAGPDFSNARIRIGQTLWAGQVEIHKRSSDWLLHQHQHDPAYNNTILHVVYEYDQAIYRASGEEIATLVLRGRIAPHYLQRYEQLLKSRTWIPCQNHLNPMVSQNCQLWLDRLATERLQEKIVGIEQQLKDKQYHWEQVFYQFLAASFGMQQNQAPFEALALSLPLKILAKHKHSSLQLEALLLGQAGLLQQAKATDDYVQALCKEYQFLAQKYQLHPLLGSSWKFGRMRPANFPTVRLAQFAQLIHQSRHLFSKIIHEPNVQVLQKLLEVELGGYWQDHYLLGVPSKAIKKSLGKRSIDLILINTVAPFLVAYGRYKGDSDFMERALELLQKVAPEKNSMIKQWNDLKVKAKNALDSQALLQLKKQYCDKKRCLECHFGHQLLQQKKPAAAISKKARTVMIMSNK